MTKNILYTMPAYYHNSIAHEAHRLFKLDDNLLSKIICKSVEKPIGVKSDMAFGYAPIRVNLIIHNTAYSTPSISTIYGDDGSPAFFGDNMLLDDVYPTTDYVMSVFIPAIYGLLEYYVPGENRYTPPNFILDTMEDCDYVLRQLLHQFADVYDETTIKIGKDLYYWYGDNTMHICIICKCDRQENGTCAIPANMYERYKNTGLLGAVLNTPEVFNL